jgi:hypothetical protein
MNMDGKGRHIDIFESLVLSEYIPCVIYLRVCVRGVVPVAYETMIGSKV